MSTIALVGTVEAEPHSLMVNGRDVVEVRVTEVTSGIDAAGTSWADDEPLTWITYVRDDTALAAMLPTGAPIRVDGRVRNLWGRMCIDDAKLSRPLSQESPADFSRPL
jgi:hypothetical protein